MGIFIFVLIIIFIVFVIFSVVFKKNLKNKYLNRLENAKSDYEISLERLKSNPNDKELRKESLKKGRIYSKIGWNINRDKNSKTVYDDSILLNDIVAICGIAYNNNQSFIEELRDELETTLSEIDNDIKFSDNETYDNSSWDSSDSSDSSDSGGGDSGD